MGVGVGVGLRVKPHTEILISFECKSCIMVMKIVTVMFL